MEHQHHTSSAGVPVQTLSVTCSAVPNYHQTNLNFPRNMISQTSQIAVAFFPRGDSNLYLIFKRKVQRFSNPRECLTVIFGHHSSERLPRKRKVRWNISGRGDLVLYGDCRRWLGRQFHPCCRELGSPPLPINARRLRNWFATSPDGEVLVAVLLSSSQIYSVGLYLCISV